MAACSARTSSTLCTTKRATSPKRSTPHNKLVSSDKVVAIVGDVTSAPSKAVAQKANDDGMPIITASGTDADITKTGKYAYRACFIDPYQGQLMADYASKELKAKTVAVLYDSGDSYSTRYC